MEDEEKPRTDITEEPLGMDAKNYRKLFRRLPGLKKFSKREEEILLKSIGAKSEEIDEDLQLACTSLFNRIGREKSMVKQGKYVPTPYGQLEKEVNKELMKLSNEGLTRKGRERIKEKLILYLIHDTAWFQFPRIGQDVVNHFTEEEIEKIRQGNIHVVKSRGEYISPFLYDKRIFDFYNLEKWEESRRSHIDLTASTKREIPNGLTDDQEKIFREAAFGPYGVPWKYEDITLKVERYEKEVRGEETQPEKERRMKWICVLSYIYAVRNTEKALGVKFFRTNRELLEIWSIPERTFYEKMGYLRDVDNHYSDMMEPKRH